jgi:hypothetical protein
MNPKLSRSRSRPWIGWKITDLFHHRNKEMIHQAVQGLRTKYNGEFNATIFLDKLDHLQVLDPHWALTSLVAMIAATICTFAIGLCIWKIFCQSKEPQMPTPSAPPMLMQRIAPQPTVTQITAPAPVKKQVVNNQAVQNNNTIPINITIT